MDRKQLEEKDLKKVSGGRPDTFYSMGTYDDLEIKDFGPGQVGKYHPLVTNLMDTCRGWKRVQHGSFITCINCTSCYAPPIGGGIIYCKMRSQEHDPYNRFPF